MAISKGNWKLGIPGTVVTDDPEGFPPNTGHTGKENVDYYGGNLIAESILKKDDAKLIAAAPELLEACMEAKRMYKEIEPCGGWQGVFEQLETAIKKATE